MPDSLPSSKNLAESEAQRAQRGFSEEDTYSLDVYLAGVIAGGLERLSERGVGCPAGMGEDSVTEGIEQWRAILDEMALGFRKYHAENGSHFGERAPELDRSFDLLREWWEHLWD